MTRSLPLLSGLGLVALLGLVGPSACTDAQLEPVPEPERPPADNKLEVTGQFCTTNPDDLNFPVKILFIIDTSQSLITPDPVARGVVALIVVIDATRDTPGVEWGIIVFGAGSNILTERCDDYDTRDNCTAGFSTDPDQAILAATGASQGAGTTDYLISLQTAVSMVAADMAGADENELENARYVVIFLSDGIPDSDSTFGPQELCPEAEAWANNGIIDDRGTSGALSLLIDQFEELGRRYHVREMAFHGAFLAAPDTALEVRACGGNLIRAMSQHGQGTFRDFSSGEELNFLFVDFTSYKRIFALKNFVVTNLNARPFSEALYINSEGAVRSDDPTLALGIIDSDADGLTDEREEIAGTSIYLQDTDGDGFSDLLEVNLRGSGFDALDPTDADCAAAIDRLDADGDGLRDCEERFVGTNPKRFDSDNDGFGDGMEQLYGSNPSLADHQLDVDFDGADNGAEMRWHSQPDQDDISFLSEHAYRYEVEELGVVGSRLCYSFNVSNISLASTRGAIAVDGVPDGGVLFDADGGIVDTVGPGYGGGAMQEGENRILFEVAESPFDAPEEPGISRLACVSARYSAENAIRIPVNGKVALGEDAFVDARDFVPELHCLQP